MTSPSYSSNKEFQIGFPETSEKQANLIPDRCEIREVEVAVAVADAVAVAVDAAVAVADAVVVDAAAAVAVEAAAATRVPRSPCGPCPRCKTFPTRYSILGGRGTRRTRTNAQFWTETGNEVTKKQ